MVTFNADEWHWQRLLSMWPGANRQQMSLRRTDRETDRQTGKGGGGGGG